MMMRSQHATISEAVGLQVSIPATSSATSLKRIFSVSSYVQGTSTEDFERSTDPPWTPPSSRESELSLAHLSTHQLAQNKFTFHFTTAYQPRRSAKFRFFYKYPFGRFRLLGRDDDERLSLRGFPRDSTQDQGGKSERTLQRRASFDVMPKSPVESMWRTVRLKFLKKTPKKEVLTAAEWDRKYRLTAEERRRLMTWTFEEAWKKPKCHQRPVPQER
ncbi:hypothetical protein VTL71DRAFT_8408 [Oculimacula yallundae]|uniref:Uncharacterized protein n=1 Tax=Oculimacula yallundae TaxID=86028 RepID=A0ABR4CXM5_9HELO